MPLTPAARPSRPSSQLIALVIPTNQITVTKRLNQFGRVSERLLSKGRVIEPIFTPWLQTTVATAICRASRGSGGNWNRSSLKPTAKKATPPSKVLQINWSRLAGKLPKPPSCQVIKRARQNPSTMPMPPRRTIGSLCCLRGSG